MGSQNCSGFCFEIVMAWQYCFGFCFQVAPPFCKFQIGGLAFQSVLPQSKCYQNGICLQVGIFNIASIGFYLVCIALFCPVFCSDIAVNLGKIVAICSDSAYFVALSVTSYIVHAFFDDV